MYNQIFVAFALLFLLCVYTLAIDIAVIKADSSQWPILKLTVAAPEGDADVENYSLFLLPEGTAISPAEILKVVGENGSIPSQLLLIFDMPPLAPQKPAESVRARLTHKRTGEAANLFFDLPATVSGALKSVPAALSGNTEAALNASSDLEASRSDVIPESVNATETAVAIANPDSLLSESAWAPWALLAALVLICLYLLRYHKKRTCRTKSTAGNSSSTMKEPAQASGFELVFPDLGIHFPLKLGTMVAGTASNNDIVLRDTSLAGHHVEFHVAEGECRVRRLDSSGTILINGTRLKGSAVLKPGDTLQIGTARAVVRML